MSAAVAWAALAGALAAAPRSVSSRDVTPTDDGAPRAPEVKLLSGRGLSAAVAGSAALVCVALLGPLTGAIVALVAMPSAQVVLARRHARRTRFAPDPSLALVLDLAAAVLRTGQPVSVALALAAPAGRSGISARLVQVAGLLRLGADPVEAWRCVDGGEGLAELVRVACRSSESGVRLAAAFEQLAADQRQQVLRAAEARAHRAGVAMMAPLGLCFLAAFVCLGVIPEVMGLAHGLYGAAP